VVLFRLMRAHRESFQVRSFEIDAWYMLSIPTLAGYLQEAAGHHATELGCGIGDLMKRGLTWVLVNERFSLPQPIRLGETLEIETWPSGTDRMALSREFVVRRRDGVIAALATTRWMVLDLASRRPMRPESVLGPEILEAADRVLPASDRRFAPLEGGSERLFPVRFGDIDVNEHANNTSYVAWVLDSAPEETWRTCRLASLEVQFLSECRYGVTVLSRAAVAGERQFQHAISDPENGVDLARAKTSWALRDCR
jgi:medium-chain acyl-[acyl-carrier-protein] hydrolase